CLGGDVRMTLFFSSQTGAARRETADLLALYREAQPRIDVDQYDLDRSPGIAKRLGVTAYDTVVVEAGERRERVELVNEETLTAASPAVPGTPPVPTYFRVGHGEHDPPLDDQRTPPAEAPRAPPTR